MKTTSLLFAALLWGGVSVSAQTATAPDSGLAGYSDAALKNGGNTNPLFRVIEIPAPMIATSPATNVTGVSQNIVQPAAAPPTPKRSMAPALTVEAGSVVARSDDYTARFSPDLRVAGAVQLQRNGEAPLRSSVIALAYYQGDRSVIIAEVKSASAQVAGSNEVLYADAFNGSGISADVVYRCGAGTFEQDVVLRGALPSPGSYGLDPANTEFAVLTEFYDKPEPALRAQALDLSEWNEWLHTAVSPLEDEIVGFPKLRMRMVPGKAFSLQNRNETVPVRKAWRVLNGRRFLIESTPYPLIAPLEQMLPAPSASVGQPGQSVFDRLPAPLDPAGQSKAVASVRNGQLPTRGVVMDYILVTSRILNVNFADLDHPKTGTAALGQSANDFWNLSNTKFNSGTVVYNNLWWSDSTASPIDLTVQNAPGMWGNGVNDDNMYVTYIYSWNAQSVFATLTQVPSDVYDLYVYGHDGGDTGNGLFKLRKNGVLIGHRGTTVWGHLWASTNWTEGEQYIVFRDVSLAPGDTLQIEVVPVGGYPHLAGLQLVPSAAVSEPVPPIQKLINIDTHGTQGGKVGPAAVGQNSTDIWNLYNQPYANPGFLQNLLYANGTASGAGLIVQNAPGQWDFGPIDPMYNGYIYPSNGGNITASVTNLPNGLYDFYIYTHTGADTASGVAHVICGGADYGTRGTTYWGGGWNSANWEEGQQYVLFRKVLVVDGNPVQITMTPYQQYYTFINGMQIVQRTEDTDGDTLPDWWEMKYFGDLNQVGTSSQGANYDFDGDGTDNATEYANQTDPNAIVFSLSCTNNYVSTTATALQLWVSNGVPSSVAVLVDSTNFAGASWSGYSSSSVSVNLGSVDGWHEVWIGLRGRQATSEQTWQWKRLKLDRVPPRIVVTSPASTVTQPMIELMGYSPEALASISCDVSNALGVFTNQMILVLDQTYNTNSWEFTTNTFQGFDLDLTTNLNRITIRALDLAGNLTTTNFNFTLTSDSVAPVVQLWWPQNNAQLCGDTFTWRGLVDDFTATLTAEVVDASGTTNYGTAEIERDGKFWFEDLALPAGTSTATLTAVDYWGNVTRTNINVTKSSVQLTITEPDEYFLNNATLTVSGTISVNDHSVWVNGIKASAPTYNGSTWTWTANDVPMTPGGTAVIEACAIPKTLADPGGDGTGGSGGSGATIQDPGNPQAPDEKKDVLQPDKRPREPYISEDDINVQRWDWNGFTEDYMGDNLYQWETHIGWMTYNQHWTNNPDANPAEFGWGGQDAYSNNHYSWTPPDGIVSCPWTFVWPFSDHPGSASVTTCDGSHPWLPVWVTSEYCELKNPPGTDDYDSWYNNPDGSTTHSVEHDTYKRSAQTKWTLFTGGKAFPKRYSLWALNASASEVLNKWQQRPFPGWMTTRPIPSQEIIVDGSHLGTDGILWKVYPDGLTKDVTAKVNDVDFYKFDVGGGKYRLRIRANNAILQTDKVVDSAKFVVGQKINFSPDWLPAEPPTQHKGPIQWAFQGDFINAFTLWFDFDPHGYNNFEENYDWANGMTDFRVDSNRLQEEQTFAWWKTSGTKDVVLGMGLTFNNGQYAAVTSKGLLKMHKPVVSWIASNYRPGVVMGHLISSWSESPPLPPGTLEVGIGDFWNFPRQNTDLYGFQLSASSASLFRGEFGLAQLIVRDSSVESWSDWRLDNAFPYDAPVQYRGLNPPYVAPFDWSDSPSNFGWSTDHFRQFFMFRPTDGQNPLAGSIWVTLGTAEWNWHGSAAADSHAPGGWFWVDQPYFWHTGSIETSSELPEWILRKSNLGGGE